MVARQKLMSGVDRLNATSAVLQRARLGGPPRDTWEAADVQWWWGRPRPTDELALPVWFDELGPVAAAGLTADGDTCQIDAFVVPGTVDPGEVWAASLESADLHGYGPLDVLVYGDDTLLRDLAIQSGFNVTDELQGTSWMEADRRPPVARVGGFTFVDRSACNDLPHPMIARNGELIEARLRQCSLYDPVLDLAVQDAAGAVAGYGLFWLDPTTLVGLVEPLRVQDGYQRRGLARMLLTNGLERLASRGARRFKVGFSNDAARNLYLGTGFIQTSTDRVFVRPSSNPSSRGGSQ